MILLDQVAGNTRTSPDSTQATPEGRHTVIILERDGSLRHYPSGRSAEGPPRAQIQLDEDETHYLLRVRRLRADEGVEVIELDRALWRARFEATTGRRCSVRIVERVEEPPEDPPVTLLLGLPDT
ncbi:MAG: hypothetical protein HC927_09395, partial [Deltaproteobacteria bacterium]|nr:hypothetical protein [Deltaproteobacteria bacterium]